MTAEKLNQGGENQKERQLLTDTFDALVRAGVIHPDNKEARIFFDQALRGDFSRAEKELSTEELIANFDATEAGTPAHAAAEAALGKAGLTSVIQEGDRYADYRMEIHYIIAKTLFHPSRGGQVAKVRRACIMNRAGEVVRIGEIDIYA